jgi:hypothetical protein
VTKFCLDRPIIESELDIIIEGVTELSLLQRVITAADMVVVGAGIGVQPEVPKLKMFKWLTVNRNESGLD